MTSPTRLEGLDYRRTWNCQGFSSQVRLFQDFALFLEHFAYIGFLRHNHNFRGILVKKQQTSHFMMWCKTFEDNSKSEKRIFQIWWCVTHYIICSSSTSIYFETRCLLVFMFSRIFYVYTFKPLQISGILSEQ